MVCIGRHVGGHALALNMAAKITSCLYLVQRFILPLRCAVNVITSSFNMKVPSLKFKCKICVQREVIHNFKNHILVT